MNVILPFCAWLHKWPVGGAASPYICPILLFRSHLFPLQRLPASDDITPVCPLSAIAQ